MSIRVSILDFPRQVAGSIQPGIVVHRLALSNGTEQGLALLRNSWRVRLLAVNDDFVGREEAEDVRDLLVDMMDLGDAAALHRCLQAGIAGDQNPED